MIRLVSVLFLVLAAALPARAEIGLQDISTDDMPHIWLAEDHTIPFIALELVFRGGAALDSDDKAGATNLMVGLLEEGAGDLNSRGFAARLQELAASFEYDISDDTVSISARFLTENRQEAFDLLMQSLADPTFEQTAIDRVRGQVLTGLKSDRTDPQAIAGKAMGEMLFGDHPYARDLSGTIETVKALTRKDIVTAHRNALVHDRLYISAAGDITAEDLTELVAPLYSALPASRTPLAGEARLNLPGGVKTVDFATPQSVVTFTQKGIALDDPDFLPAYILNHILGGGGFESRLMQELREKRGLTYGVYTYLADKDGAKLLMGSFASSNARVAEAIEMVRREWARIREEGVTAKELQDAKTYLTGAYPLRFDGYGPIANIAADMQLNGFPTDYIATRNDKVNAVTLEDVNRVAKKLLSPEELSFVVVGQPEGLENSRQ